MSKFYAVRAGRETGICTDWEECRRRVIGFPGASFKSFPTWQEAEAFMETGRAAGLQQADRAQAGAAAAQAGAAAARELPEEARLLEAFVDGSYNAATGVFGYGLLLLFEGEEQELFGSVEDSPLASMRNVAGEIRAAREAMSYALEQGFDALVIYHDYEGIAKWCTGEWKANKPGTIAYRDYYQSIRDRLQVRFVKVKGHSGNALNDRADGLAKKGAGIIP